MHDVVHAVLHVDKGFFYTIKELFTRPGHSIREYVQGKRTRHFNYFTFILLIITIGHIIGNFSDTRMTDIVNYSTGSREFLRQYGKFSSENPKFVVLIQVPFLAFFSFLFFRKSKQNYTEHLVLNAYKVSAELILMSVFGIVTIFYKKPAGVSYLFSLVSVTSVVYSAWFYRQYFSVFGYSKLALLFRSVMAAIILVLVVATITAFSLGMNEGFQDGK